MSHISNTLHYEARAIWLQEQGGYTEGDVMEDQHGEFILVDGEYDYEKEYLPTELQSQWTN